MAAVRNLRFVLTGVDKSASKAIDGVTKKAGALNGAMKFAAGGAITGLAGIAVAAVKTESEFSSVMNQMSAVAGVPAAGLENLRDLAKKMGAETVFSASDAADAMLELAKGGLTAAQIESGALAATLSLAAAGGLELGDAATYMSNAMNTFGLQAKDAESIAAALAGGANASSASVESLGLALSQVGPGAKTAGLSLQETVGVLAAFDNAGIKGSDAGTSLKTMLTRLVPSTDKAADKMKQLGLDFTNADGSFKDIAEVSEILRRRLSKLTDEQRTSALATVFGSDATRAATVLMNEGRVGVEKYTKATSDQEAAQRVAKSRMEGTAGAIEQLKGSLETAALVIGEELAPYVADLAGKLTELTNGFVNGTGPGGEFKNTLGDLRDVAVDLWPALRDTAKFLGDMIGWAADHPDAFKAIASSVAGFAAAVKVAQIQSHLMGINGPRAATGIVAVGSASKANAGKVNSMATAMGRLVGPLTTLAMLYATSPAVRKAINGEGMDLGEGVKSVVTGKDAGEGWKKVLGIDDMPAAPWNVNDEPKSTPVPRVAPRPGGSSQDRPTSVNPTTTTYPRRGQTAGLHVSPTIDGHKVTTAVSRTHQRLQSRGYVPAF